ncbi:MAG: hypothetical protein ACOYB3_14825 [Azonexus sp.]|jgi:hypothetical protein
MKYSRNKRSGEDRRDEDCGPPSGWSERRKSVERRRPEVREISFAEWIAYMRKKPCKTQ